MRRTFKKGRRAHGVKKVEAINQEGERTARAETHLLALTSHQLKTPLGIIRGYCSLLREGLYGPLTDVQKTIVSKMEFAAQDVVNFIDTIIDFRNVEESRVRYQMEMIDIADVVQRAAREMEHLAMGKGLALRFSTPSKKIMLCGDEQKIRHIVQNFIDNAIKYTQKGFIAVAIKEGDKIIRISIKDSGMGISSKTLPKLFHEFVRDPRVKKAIEGTGMGLYIAKIFAEAHGGKVTASSKGVGKGSTFTLILPTTK